MRLIIRNMESGRCILKVEELLRHLGMPYICVELGYVDLPDSVTAEQIRELERCLRKYEYIIIKRKKEILAEQIKSALFMRIRDFGEGKIERFSDYLVKTLGFQYQYMSNVFMEVMHITIRKFIILQKVERAKEMIATGDYSFADIGFKLHYSDAAHFTREFKEITGFTPSEYKRRGENSAKT